MAKKNRIPHKFHPWINARKQFRLSDAHIQMARELGLSPKRFAKYADRENQPWKLPLTQFIEAQYLKQFGKERPDEVKPMEEIAAAHVAKRAARKLANADKANAAQSRAAEASTPPLANAPCGTTTPKQTPADDQTMVTGETETTSQAPAQPKPTTQATAPEDAPSATDKTEVTQPASEAAPFERDTSIRSSRDTDSERD